MVVTAQEYTDSVPVVLNSYVQYSVIGLIFKEKKPPTLYGVILKRNLKSTSNAPSKEARRVPRAAQLFTD